MAARRALVTLNLPTQPPVLFIPASSLIAAVSYQRESRHVLERYPAPCSYSTYLSTRLPDTRPLSHDTLLCRPTLFYFFHLHQMRRFVLYLSAFHLSNYCRCGRRLATATRAMATRDWKSCRSTAFTTIRSVAFSGASCSFVFFRCSKAIDGVLFTSSFLDLRALFTFRHECHEPASADYLSKLFRSFSRLYVSFFTLIETPFFIAMLGWRRS